MTLPWLPCLIWRGLGGHQIIEDIAPEPGDFVIKKHRPSGVVGTNMDLLLKNAGIQRLVFTGVVTEGCVEATVRSAVHHDYYVVIVQDGVASKDPEAHAGSLRWYARHFDRPTLSIKLDKCGPQAHIHPGASIAETPYDLWVRME